MSIYLCIDVYIFIYVCVYVYVVNVYNRAPFAIQTEEPNMFRVQKIFAS
jgi:hypothetical protein